MASSTRAILALYPPPAKLRLQTLEIGELMRLKAPKAISELNKMFQTHKLSNFQSMYYCARREMDIASDARLNFFLILFH